MLKILQLAPVFRVAGVPRVIVEQTLALRKLGYDCRIACRGLAKGENDFFKAVKRYVIKKPSLSFLHLNFFTSHFVPLKLPQSFRPDVILSHNFVDAKRGLKIAEASGAKFGLYLHNMHSQMYTLQFHENIPLLRLFRWNKRYAAGTVRFLCPDPLSDTASSFWNSGYGRRIYSKIVDNESKIVAASDFVLGNSRLLANHVQEAHGVRPKVVYPGATSSRSIPDSRGEILLAFPSQILPLIVRTHPRLKTKIKVVGFLTRGLRKALIQSGIAPLQNVSDQTLQSLYSSCRVFFNSIQTWFGMWAVECATHGAPIIQNGLSGSSEIFKHGVDGYFPMEHDEAEYIRFIGDLMQDERKAFRMGRHAWTTIQKYTWEKHAKDIVASIKRG